MGFGGGRVLTIDSYYGRADYYGATFYVDISGRRCCAASCGEVCSAMSQSPERSDSGRRPS